MRPVRAATELAERGRDVPGRRALRDDSGDLTFEELDGLAGTLARMIVERVGEGAAPVPILVRRDRWSAGAIHAAVRAGRPFVPLAEDLPPSAMADLLRRIGGPTVAVVTRPELRDVLPASVAAVVMPTEVEDPIDPQPVATDDPATVIFTSGSTGRPKGVVLDWSVLDERIKLESDPISGTRDPFRSHAACTAPFQWVGGLGQALRVALGTSYSIADRALRSPLDLLEWLERGEFTEISLVPSLAARVVGSRTRRLESVMRVSMSGETLHGEHIPAVRALVNEAAMLRTAYGATEGGGLTVLINVIRPGDEVPPGPVPLGEPAYPERARFVPVEGSDDDGLTEIVVCGTLARGYLDDPELEAARFGVDEHGSRYWRSGDLVRRDHNGALRHAARLDDLVKIGGKLVEAAEPERVLRAMPEIRQVVVLPHETRRGKRLVAHVALAEDASLTPADVRSRLTEQLPPHLVPSALARHHALPMTPNNKVDRARLRSEPFERWRTTTTDVPSDQLTTKVRAICAEVLELDEVGPDDDLWELGLDSLAAIELVEALSGLGWGRLDATALLTATSPVQIASRLRRRERRRRDRAAAPVVTLNPYGNERPIFALPGAGGTALAFHWLGRALGDAQPLVVVEPRGLHAPGTPDRTLENAIATVSAAIASRSPDGPVTLIGHSGGGVLAYATGERLHAEGRAVRVVMLDSRTRHRRPDGSVAPRAPAPTRRRAPQSLSPAELRALARRARVRYRVWRPGRPSPDPARYNAFRRIWTVATRGYAPAPPEFPVLLLYTSKYGAREAWQTVIPDLRCEAIGGDHRSHLTPPHVADVARHIRGFHEEAAMKSDADGAGAAAGSGR